MNIKLIPNVLAEEQKLNLPQLSIILNFDYVTMLSKKNEMFPDLLRSDYITGTQLQEFVLRHKENHFLFSFETNPNETFMNRMLKYVTYDVRKDPQEWLEPKVLKFLLDLVPWDIQKLRNQKKIIFKKEFLPYRKSTSKNEYIFIYERESVIEYILANYGLEKLSKTYLDTIVEPQFLTVTKMLEYLKNRNINISQARAYRMIDRSEIPANRISDSLRIPIKELNVLISEGELK
jgi:hypothetical protein